MPEPLHSTRVLSDRLHMTDVPEIIDLLLASKKIHMTIEGYSMYPTLHIGDLIEVEPKAEGGFQVGDIVVIQKEKQLICHRLVEISERDGETRVRTKGDAMEISDPSIKSHQVLGKVSRIERNGTSWIPSPFPKKLSMKDVFILFLERRVEKRLKIVLRNLLIRCQSSALFRFLYRFFIRIEVTYSIGIPASSTDTPKFWNYLSTLPMRKAHLKGVGNGSTYRFFAKVGGNIVGSLEIKATGKENRSEWVISHLFVRARYRGCGIGTTLLKQAFQVLRKLEVPTLKVEVASHNRVAGALLRRLGFSSVEKCPMVGQKSAYLRGKKVPLQDESILFKKEISYPIQLLAREKELEPFLYHVCSINPSVRPSPRQIESLKGSLVKNAATQFFFEQALFEIDDAFKKAGIPFIVQKGMVLAYLLYPDPAMRPMVDIDLYLRKEDIPSATAVLRNLGYEMKRSELQGELLVFGGELSFYRENSPVVELHWCLEQYERLKGIVKIDEQDLWDRAVSYEISGNKFLTFSPEHHLLSLTIHLGLIHRFRGVKWFLDIDRLVSIFGEDLNWEELFQTARAWGIEGIVCQVLLATQEFFNTLLPPLPMRKRSFLLKYPALQWLLLDRFEDRLQVILRVFFPSREWLIYRYRLKQRGCILLYRLLHPLFILIRITK